MDNQVLLNYLKQYFNYVRKIFLEEYASYLNYDLLEKINNMTCEFRIDNDAQFKIYRDDKINVCLDVEKFINSNDLNSDAGLKDIDISAKVYIKHLNDNKDDVNRVVLSVILKPIIQYMLDLKNDVLSLGVTDLIVDDLSNKYRIKYIAPYPSKEAEVTKLLFKIIDEKNIYEAVLNNQLDSIKETILYDVKLGDILDSLDNKYDVFSKRIGKVYYADTLYDYQTIDYTKEKNQILNLVEIKSQNNDTKKERLISMITSLRNLKKHSFIFDNSEQQRINHYLEKVESLSNNEKVTDEDYQMILNLEDNLMPLIYRLWKGQLTDFEEYNGHSSFNFLVGNDINKDIVEAKFISDNHLRSISNKLKNNYGYIYKMDNNIIYASSKDILISKTITDNENTINFRNIKIDIDNQRDSKIMTPDVLMRDDLKNKHNGSVVLYKPEVLAVFALIDNEFSTDYAKAKELSDNYELPLVKINRNIYESKVAKEELPHKMEVTSHKRKEVINRPKLKDRIKSFKNSLLYEEHEEKSKVA